jgi:drug/metabolite transporter (DMT)-like permease
VNPIVAVLLGAAFAGETLSMRVLIAGALIIGSVAIVITAQQLTARAEPASRPAIEPAD